MLQDFNIALACRNVDRAREQVRTYTTAIIFHSHINVGHAGALPAIHLPANRLHYIGPVIADQIIP